MQLVNQQYQQKPCQMISTTYGNHMMCVDIRWSVMIISGLPLTKRNRWNLWYYYMFVAIGIWKSQMKPPPISNVQRINRLI